MALTDTPRSNRLHIAFYGRRNAGKSSLINLVTGQQTALVSIATACALAAHQGK